MVRRQCHALNRIILILSVRLSPGNPLHGSIFSLSFFFIYSCLFVCHFHFHQNIALLTRVIPFYFICFVHTFSFLFYFSYTYYSVYYLFLFFLLCSLHPLSWTVLFALFEIVFTKTLNVQSSFTSFVCLLSHWLQCMFRNSNWGHKWTLNMVTKKWV